MDLLSLVRLLLRHRWAVLPIVLLTAAAAGYVIAFVPFIYNATSSYVFINPPPPYTAEEIARDPSLGEVQSDNPLLRFSDPRTVVVLVASRINASATRDELVDAGVDDRYEVVPTNRFGIASPILDVNAVGADEATTLLTARLVGDAVARELRALQTPSGVDDRFMITLQLVEFPDSAERQISGTLRMLIGVLVLGMFALFTLVSVLEVLDKKRAEHAQERRERLNQLADLSRDVEAPIPREREPGHIPPSLADMPPDALDERPAANKRTSGIASV